MTLTAEQLAAVNSDANRLMIAACAGSGKTAVLIARIVRLVESGIRPEEIVALSFTISASKEMETRLGAAGISGVFAGTIHSFAWQLIREHQALLPMLADNIVVIDAESAEELLREITGKKPKATMTEIRAAIRLGPFGWGNAEDFHARAIAGEYFHKLQSAGLLDFDSIIHYGCALFEGTGPKLDYNHALIDEGQDLTAMERQFCELLSIPSKAYFQDENQAIFGFRELQ